MLKCGRHIWFRNIRFLSRFVHHHRNGRGKLICKLSECFQEFVKCEICLEWHIIIQWSTMRLGIVSQVFKQETKFIKSFMMNIKYLYYKRNRGYIYTLETDLKFDYGPMWNWNVLRKKSKKSNGDFKYCTKVWKIS